jgi:CBS domain containing-hemolysin-like protein
MKGGCADEAPHACQNCQFRLTIPSANFAAAHRADELETIERTQTEMKTKSIPLCRRSCWLLLALLGLLVQPADAHASLFKGEALDKAANVMAWVVLVVAPVIAITVFWLIHILPEKIAEKRQHPQAKAIQTLCLLSLFFGGLLWPLAWLWAYSKPVMYKLAYGTDKVPHGHDDPLDKDEEELRQLRQRLAELESKQARKLAPQGEKA